MTTEELLECGRLLELQDSNTINREQVQRLAILKLTAKRDLPTGNTAIVKKQIAEVLAEQIGSDILKFLETLGEDVVKLALPMLIESLSSSIKKA